MGGFDRQSDTHVEQEKPVGVYVPISYQSAMDGASGLLIEQAYPQKRIVPDAPTGNNCCQSVVKCWLSMLAAMCQSRVVPEAA
jgi:hypothetical protein